MTFKNFLSLICSLRFKEGKTVVIFFLEVFEFSFDSSEFHRSEYQWKYKQS